MNNKTGIWLSGAFALISGIASVVMILLDIGRLAALPVIASAAAFIYITTVLFKSSGLYAKGSGQFGISNESWRIILDSMPVHFFVKDADKEFVYILSNQKTGNLLGIKGRDMIGKTDAKYFRTARMRTISKNGMKK